MKLLFVILIAISTELSSGELDGKGLVCKIYGDTIGYFFDSDRAFEFKPILQLSINDAFVYFIRCSKLAFRSFIFSPLTKK